MISAMIKYASPKNALTPIGNAGEEKGLGCQS
jgi:hypothetical protein